MSCRTWYFAFCLFVGVLSVVSGRKWAAFFNAFPQLLLSFCVSVLGRFSLCGIIEEGYVLVIVVAAAVHVDCKTSLF